MTTIASVAATTLLLSGIALAQQTRLTQADFERCHRQAMQVAGVWTESPAASPGVTAPHGTVTQPGPTTTTPPATSPGPAPGASGTGAGTEPTRSGGLGVGPHSGTGPGSYGAGTGVGATGDRAMQVERAVQAYRDCLIAAQ
jgi:hypothetical protein